MNRQIYYKNTSGEQFDRFISLLKNYKDCKLVSEKLGTDNGHFHTYKFLSEKGRFALHYDTFACIVQINAPDEIHEGLEQIINSLKTDNPAPQQQKAVQKEQAKPTEQKPQQQKAVQKEQPKPTEQKPQQPKAQPKEQAKAKEQKPQQQKAQPKEQARAKEQKPQQPKAQPKEQARAKEQKPQQSKAQPKEQARAGDSKHPLERVAASLEDKMNRIVIAEPKPVAVVAKPAPIEVKKEKPKEQKKEVKDLDKQVAAARKSLKKELEAAFDYLSESSIVQIFNARRDLERSNLSNYSGMLLPLFTALEYIIVNLQRKEGVFGTTLGQAFTRDGEGYILKPAIAKKTGIVYNEVITALYNEYYKRHKYVHAHSRLGSTDTVSDKKQAKAIFTEILYLLNYNCKKLSEINYPSWSNSITSA